METFSASFSSSARNERFSHEKAIQCAEDEKERNEAKTKTNPIKALPPKKNGLGTNWLTKS